MIGAFLITSEDCDNTIFIEVPCVPDGVVRTVWHQGKRTIWFCFHLNTDGHRHF